MKFPAPNIFIHHFAQNSQKHLVYSLRLSVALWIIWFKASTLNAISQKSGANLLIHKWGPIISHNLVWDAKTKSYVFSNEVGNSCFGAFLSGMASAHFVK